MSQWILIPNQSCYLLYSFWTKFVHSLNTRFRLTSVFPHILFLLFSWVLLIFAFILLVFRACYFAAIIKASVFLFKHPFLSHPTNHHFLCRLFTWWIMYIIVFVLTVFFFCFFFSHFVLIRCFSIFIVFYSACIILLILANSVLLFLHLILYFIDITSSACRTPKYV